MSFVLAVILAVAFAVPAEAGCRQAGARPTQGWLFDGSTAAGATYGFGFTRSGLEAVLGSGVVYICPPELGPGDRVSLSAAHKGLFFPLTDPDDLTLCAPGTDFALQPKLDPTTLQDDCDVVANLTQVQAYLAALIATADTREQAIRDCLDDVRQLHCDVREALASTPTLPPDEPEEEDDFCLPGGSLLGLDPGVVLPQTCDACRTALFNLPPLVDGLGTRVTECGFARDRVAQDLATIQAAAGLEQDQKDCYALRAATAVSQAQQLLGLFLVLRGTVNAEKAACDVPNLPATCPCGSALATATSASTAAARRVVQTEDGARVLRRFVRILRKAGRRATDPAEAARLLDLAERLRVPNGRVLHVCAPGAGEIGQSLVAMRPASVPDDGVTPRVVVISLHGQSPGSAPPAITPAEIDVLFGGLTAFRQALPRGVPGVP